MVNIRLLIALGTSLAVFVLPSAAILSLVYGFSIEYLPFLMMARWSQHYQGSPRQYLFKLYGINALKLLAVGLALLISIKLSLHMMWVILGFIIAKVAAWGAYEGVKGVIHHG